MRWLLAAGAVVWTIPVLAGCGMDGQTGAAPSPDGSESPAVNQHLEPDGDYPTPSGQPTWSAEARKSAVNRAEEAMTAFTSTDTSADAWWKGLKKHLSQTARSDYSGTDPRNVPAREVTGQGKLVDDSSAYLARVRVPTDIGGYEVLLSRTGNAGPWMVERMTPPEGG